MKSMIVLLAAIFAAPTFACEIQEAQFIATVVNIENHATGCRTYLHAEKIEMFNPSFSCPLSFGEVSGYGIELGLDSSNKCRLDVGDQISGVLVRINGGDLILQ